MSDDTPSTHPVQPLAAPPSPPSLPGGKRVYFDPTDVAVRLRAMGLTEKALAAAVRVGQDARSSCTANDPPSGIGIFGWFRTVRGLRENTLPLGWVRFADNKIHGVINKAGTVVIAVATGDEATGCRDAVPKTSCPKGLTIQNAVVENARQLAWSFPVPGHDVIPIRKAVAPKAGCLLWLLVPHEADEEVRFELSLPDEIGEDERVDSWRERIILAPIPNDPSPREEVDGEDSDLDIPLTRKE